MYTPHIHLAYENKPCENQRAFYAPPLSAFSPDAPGGSERELEYTIEVSTNRRSRYSLITPLVHRKMDELKSIGSTGYTTIRPVGIGRTLGEIEADRTKEMSSLNSAPSSAEATAENTHEGITIATSFPEADLDADVVDMDDGAIAEDSAFLSDEENDDDGFMADEVEYQPDHSLELVSLAPPTTSQTSSRVSSRRPVAEDPEVSMDMDI
ncbi:hypothetical protein DIURU_001581 [Diutina rugosa]|uniref:Uncharacterized protein n=1 Tax=Diutina rugosa TaxID=5481 RepID=A0A642UTI0_DIURU|nr:uncharacterized protein DIURU_001581 [Diutina rugosa]KAA8905153.1 hypothetical protein DIURU_001581 [Diutina rugosa]